MKTYPAIEIRGGLSDLLQATLDDYSPTAIDDCDQSVRAFFASDDERNRARATLATLFDVTPVDVPDEDWARRSQENVGPVTVGRITVAPPWSALSPQPLALSDSPSVLVVVISPSMGFGTGHHATTRLCLAALQTLDLAGRFVLDVGTGSGVLAIAADRLGAARALGIDSDADAIQSAEENLALNPDVTRASFAVADLRATALPHADVVTANLTGALLVRAARDLLEALPGGGVLVVSGLLAEERDEVVDAFPGEVVWEGAEDGWVGLAVKKS